MDDIRLCFACKHNPRLFLVTARDEHTGALMHYALRPKNRDYNKVSVRIYLSHHVYFQLLSDDHHVYA